MHLVIRRTFLFSVAIFAAGAGFADTPTPQASPGTSAPIATGVQGVSGGVPLAINNAGVNTLESIACNGGVSPCTIGTIAATVLNANPTRHECLLQNVGTTDFYCIKGAGTPSTVNMHFVLSAASAVNKAGGAYSCNQGPGVWTGTISCVSSGASGSLNAGAD